MLEVIKDYMVSLGFKVDTSSLNTAKKAMSQAEDMVGKFAGSSVTNFAKSSAAVVTFVAAANLALAKFMGGLAKADLENEIFARKMWMNVDSARAYTSSINALGVSLQDLYLSPELMGKYLELNQLAKGMEVPGYDKAMLGVRDITFEFQKLKLEGTYALQWIAFYLTKILDGPMGGLKKGMASVNEMIQENMPKWTERIAMAVSWFVRLGLAAWKIRDVLGAIMLAFTAFTAFSAVKMLSNPFALMLLGLTALLLLVDDFTTWQKGGDSAFPKLWEWVKKLGDSLNANGLSFKTFKKDFQDIAKSAGELGTTFNNLLTQLGVKGGLVEVLKDGIIATLTTLNGLLIAVNGALKEFNALTTGKTTIPDIASGKADKKFADPAPEDNSKPIYGGVDDAVFGFFKNLFGGKFSNPFKSFSISPMAFGGGEGGGAEVLSFKKMQTGIEKMASLMAYQSPTAAGGLNASPTQGLGYMFPQSTQSSGITQISMAPVYQITTPDPSGVATQTSRTNTSLITRAVQGVNR